MPFSTYIVKSCILLWAFAFSIGALFAAPTARLANGSNSLVVTADVEAPRVSSLATTNGDAWQGQQPAHLIDHANVGGREQRLRWRFNSALSHSDSSRVSFVYDAVGVALRLSWEWQARAEYGPIEHSVRIENRTGVEAWLPLQDSLDIVWMEPEHEQLEQLWIDKGAVKAPPVGTHVVAVGKGYRWAGTSSTYAHPRDGQPREIIPYILVRRPRDGAGWYAGIEFSGRTRVTLERQGKVVSSRLGMNPDPEPFRTRLAAGESFVTPTVFLGATTGSLDDAGNLLRRWVRAVLNDPATVKDPAYPLLVNNSWGSEMQINDMQARRMIDDAHELGFEMFHLDAGWFRAVGDWHPDPAKFPNGLSAIAAYAHERGMRFGLWADWAQAGTSREAGALNVNDLVTREWLTVQPSPEWKPEPFKGVTIDLGASGPHAWATGETQRLVRDYHLDMLEHDGYVVAQGCERPDHPHASAEASSTHRYRDEDFLWVDGSNSTDVSYHASLAYYDIQSKLKATHPGLLLEVCNDGGRMVDFGSAAHGDYFSIIDSYDPLSNRQAFYDASHLFPPAMLETYVREWPTPTTQNFLYMLRSGMMGWFTLMLDTTTWTAQQHAMAKEELRLYKEELRPLIRNGDLYHVGARPDGQGWDATEYFDASIGRGVLYAFHGADKSQVRFRCHLRGLQPSRRYQLYFHDRTGKDRSVTGAELAQEGIDLSLPEANSSELVFFAALPD
jgi:hypothetical protein